MAETAHRSTAGARRGGRGAARGGQAFIELSIGMLVLALVMSALFSFASYIITSLDLQRSLRVKAGKKALVATGASGSFSSAEAKETITVEPVAGEYFFNSQDVEIKESVYLPQMSSIDEL